MFDLQTEHRVWVSEMYPDQEPFFPACGLVEEIGELVKPVLKAMQRDKWGQEPRYENRDWMPELEDAIGDVAIVSCSLCNACGVKWTVGTCEPMTVRDVLRRLVSLSTTCFVHGTVTEQTVAELTGALRLLSMALSVDFDKAVSETWARVKTRRRV